MNALLALRPAKPLGVQLRASMPVPCQRRLPEGLPLHHPFQNRTIPRLALNLPPLSKVKCCRPKKIRATTGGIVTPSPLPKPHYHTRFSYCNRLCVLVWFCIRAKLRAHTLRHPCLACPSRCTEPLYPHDNCKRTIIHRSHQPFSKPHYPSKIANTLAFK